LVEVLMAARLVLSDRVIANVGEWRYVCVPRRDAGMIPIEVHVPLRS
jgi:hypothetical protein